MLLQSLPKPVALLLLCSVFFLTACDKEPTERKAFQTFLQTRILDKAGLRVPKPSAEERGTWGKYASHYDVILNFHEAMNEKVAKPLSTEMQRGRILTVQQLVDRYAEMKSVYENLQRFEPLLNEELAKAEQARGALSQPPDLKTTFDASFERIVKTPATAMKEALPPALATIKSALDLGDFLIANKSRVKIQGVLMETTDPALQKDIQTRLSAMQELQKKAQEAQRKLQGQIQGG